MRKAQIQKEKIIQVALDLFHVHGYENTPVQKVIDQAGISKGAFYHYFKSKEDIINELVSARVDDMLQMVKNVSGDSSMNGVTKLNTVFLLANQYRMDRMEENRKLFSLLSGDSNLLFRERFMEYTVEKICPVYAEILKQGNLDGTLNTPYPEETAEFILRFTTEYRKKIFEIYLGDSGKELKIKRIKSVAGFMQYTFEKLLNIENGAVDISKEFTRSLT